MRQALQLAREAELNSEVPVGAVLVDNLMGGVVGLGRNSVIGLNDPTAHAEIVAIRDAGDRLGNYRLPNTTLYVTLEPCPMCMMALVHARISRLVYATDDPRTGAAGSLYQLHADNRLNHLVSCESGLCRDEASLMLKKFFQARR